MTDWIQELDRGFRAEIIRRDPSAEEWLETLPDIWRRISGRWGLVAAGPARTGRTSLVLPVTTSAGSAALKLVSPAASMDAEATALTTFGGNSAVALFDADRECQALLLEWLDGPPLSAMPDTSAAMSIAGGLARQLATATPPVGTPRLGDQAGAWLTQLRQQHVTAQRAGAGVPDRDFAVVVDVVQQLAADTCLTLTHGDLSLSNILWAGNDRWVAIDPLLVSGTAAFEAHTVARSHLDAIIAADDPAAQLDLWTRQFSQAAGVDYVWSQALSFARYVASYYWESQNDGLPENVSRLKQVVTRLAGAY